MESLPLELLLKILRTIVAPLSVRRRLQALYPVYALNHFYKSFLDPSAPNLTYCVFASFHPYGTEFITRYLPRPTSKNARWTLSQLAERDDCPSFLVSAYVQEARLGLAKEVELAGRVVGGGVGMTREEEFGQSAEVKERQRQECQTLKGRLSGWINAHELLVRFRQGLYTLPM
ncbi:hypothetical protein HK097_009654 [Rhizophlyctis rosea]|uniref:Uncharacterized protein n=1 Tax=Rhizophlyctis rosea TaxID=64517 RepID=A0AAD5S8L6_9FUNG|nr:hypothetical protein HK097_009654 [Rhizophlyctis rosea]